jgi:hypothetical protein
MLTCCNLKQGESLNDFCAAMGKFTEHMKKNNLVESMSPIGRRQNDTIMDTDTERDQVFICWEDI